MSRGSVPGGVPGDPPRLTAATAALLFDALPVGLALVSQPGTIDWANPAYFATTGRDRDLIGTNYHALPESDGTWSPAIRDAMDAALAEGIAATFRSVRAKYRGPGRPVYLDVDVRALNHADGAPAQALLQVRDVSDRVEEHDRASLFYTSFLASTNAMQLTDAKGVMVDVNPAFERIYGYTRDECVGRTPRLVRSRYTPPEVYEAMWRDLLDPARGYWSGEVLNRDRVGHERPVLLSITAIREPGQPATHYLGVAVDLSEQRSWELRAAHADKLASVGQLAAGVAHEINTPLANVMLVAESIRRRTTDPWITGRLDRMSDQVEVAARIVRGLLDFARREPPHRQEVDLRDIARTSVEFLRGKQSMDVEVDEDYPAAAVPVSADRGQLMQVLTNLLNNAYDAMHGKGRILVHVGTTPTRAVVQVRDTGPGIPDEVLPHIFEPFFTTKPEGEGTGLGLAICHGIVHAHHGSITAANVPGAGAQFRVTLPLSVGPGSSAGAHPVHPVPLPTPVPRAAADPPPSG
jgi:PAS domain S-box-containing protein